MCDTCGCSDDFSVQITDPAERITNLTGTPSAHGHSHEHSAGPERPHAHTDGAPDGRQQDGHEHAHDGHGRGQAHDHHSREQSGALNDHPASRIVRFEQNVLAKNNLIAERNRGWFEGRGILALNLMSSPGAGKTTLLERMLADLAKEVWLSVIEGDQETARDAERIRRAGAQAIQINTGSGCHLDAQMISAALRKLAPPAHSLVMIENVGNLVCPALFDLGEAEKVVIMSVTEGEDKPLKYPHMFRAAGVMLVNKIDLIPHLEFDIERCCRFAREINPKLEIMRVSARTGDGLDAWYRWLRVRIEAFGVERRPA
jgi:hydrogenase nickel incorporation protein HypB